MSNPPRRRPRPWLFVLIGTLVASPPGLAAQSGNPSAHFGASTLPDTVRSVTVGLHLDRFTPFAQVLDGRRRYNDLEQTVGFNMLHASVVRAVSEHRIFVRFSGQLGLGHNQPTEWIQRRLHALVGYDPVEVVDPRNHALDGAATIEAWVWGVTQPDLFVGVGATAGTPYIEGYAFAGFARRLGDGPSLSSVLRGGVARGGSIFPSETLAGAYASVEVRVDLPLAEWFERAWVPTLFVGVTEDTGFFSDSRLGPRPERNGTFGFTAPSGRWSVEFWNEYFGGAWQDIGPTGGGRFSWRLGGE
ncbi:MAG: hypothetical protein AAF389_17430 [Gemmatimonadota bacterium]